MEEIVLQGGMPVEIEKQSIKLPTDNITQMLFGLSLEQLGREIAQNENGKWDMFYKSKRGRFQGNYQNPSNQH